MNTQKYIVDCISNDNYFVIKKSNGEIFVNISKRCNTLENIKRFLGILHIEKIIQWKGGEKMTKGVKLMISKRKEAGITQEKLADELGIITRSTIGSIEIGLIKPSIRSAKAIANYLGFDWTLFFEEE